MKFNFNKGTYTDCLSSDKYNKKTRIEEPSGLRTSWQKFATLLPQNRFLCGLQLNYDKQ